MTEILEHIAVEDSSDEIAALVRTLHETQQRLQELAGGEVDAVIHPGGQSYMLHDAQEKLRASEMAVQGSRKRLRNLIDGLGPSIFVALLTREGILVEINQPPLTAAGLKPEDVLGKQFAETPWWHSPESRQQLRESIVRAAHGNSSRYDVRTQGAGGAVIDIDFSLQPLRDESGEVAFLIASASVITERKQAEEALQRQQTELRVLFDLVPAMIWFKDTQNGFLRANERAAEATGMRVEEIEGKSAYEIFPQHAAGYYADDLEVIESGAPKMGILEKMRGADGQETWIQTDKVPYFDSEGKVIGLVAMVQDISERQRASADLMESRQRLELATQSAGLGIWEWDLVTNKLVWDVAMYALYGIQEHDFSGAYEAWQSGVHPDDRQRSEAEIFAAVEGVDGFHTEFRVVWPDGEVHDIEAHAVMRRAVDGFSSRMVGVNRDITDRKRMERALRDSEERYRQTSAQLAKVLDSSLDAICTFDAEGCFIQVSAACEKIWGYRPEELLGTPYIEKVLPEDRARSSEAAIAVMAGQPTRSFENRYVRKDGAVTHILWSAWWSEADQSMFCVARDDTDRQRTEERVAEQAALIDESRDAIVVRDLEHRITFWSKGAERLYGWAPSEARGSVLQKILQIDDSRFAEADRMTRSKGAWNGEIRKVARSGAVLTLDCRWTLVRDSSGAPQSILSIDTDITERRKIEQQFLRAQRMESIGTLAGGIAHDLNNMLSPIMVSLDLLQMKFPDPDSQELLQILSSSARRGSDMVRQVLSFARGVEGERQELQIRHLIRDIEKFVSDTFAKNVRVRTSVPNDLWTVPGDATQLHQVLLNLCVNARDAMPDGGTLLISAENLTLDAQYAEMNLKARAGTYVLIQVEDSGTGMPPSVVEKIFDPFFTTKEIGKGTGLGLSTCLAVVKSHGGFLEVYSELEKGTRFRVYLPAHTEITGEVVPKPAAELPRGNGELILVVDDESSLRLITQQTLQAFGYRVTLASDGAEAVAIYARQGSEISAVLTDMMMPVMDGPATIQVLRKLNPAVRIIAASGLSSNGETGSLGVKHFLPKPYTAATLLRALKETLQERSSAMAPLPSLTAPLGANAPEQ